MSPSSVPGVLYLVRHGQSTWNVQRRTQGQTAHPPLTPLGCEQAAHAAGIIADDLAARGRTLRALVSSDLARAAQTADLIGQHLGLTPIRDPRLREQHLGALQGLEHEAALAAAADVDWSDPDAPVAGGESARDVHERMAAALAGLSDAVVVSHGDALRHAIGHLRGHAPGTGPWLEIRSAQVFVVDADGVRSLGPD